MITNETVQRYIDAKGPPVVGFLAQDSGNRAYVVETPEGRRWLKVLDLSRTPIDNVTKLVELYNSIESDLVPRNWIVVEASDGTILECDWVSGTVLGSPTEGRSDPDSGYRRFQALPVDQRRAVFERILNLFVELERKDVVVEDFYDGCIIYDFANAGVHVCDLDHAHWGAYVLDRERQFGSSRFMAPEEWRRGCIIDHRTNVYTLAATGFVLLADNERSAQLWPMQPSTWAVLSKATSVDPLERFQTVEGLRRAWREATGPRSRSNAESP